MKAVASESAGARAAAAGRSTARVPPGPRFRTALGFLKAMREDPLGFLVDCRERFGDVVRIQFPPFESYLVAHPDGIRHVLHDNHKNYWKGAVLGKLERIGGKGLVFADGELWRRQRQLVQPAFHRQRIEALAGMMTTTIGELLDRWEATAGSGSALEVDAEMSHLTLGIVTRALFGADLGEDEAPFTEALTAAMGYANHLLNHLFTPPLYVPLPVNLRARRAIGTIDRIVGRLVADKRRHVANGADGAAHPDLLGMLVGARDAETHETMSDRQLRDEIVTFLVAGHETTAVALSWTWHLLAQHPDVEQRLHAEVDAALGDRTPEVHDLGSLPYTRMVLEESMRLYPPVWGTNREAYEDDEILGYRIPAKRVVTVSPWVTHRHPDLWPGPEHFDPERFSPERSQGRHEYAYLPFGGGPRACIGRQFAMMEGQLALAMIARRFRLASVAGERVEPNPILTLRPKPRVAMTREPRHPSTGVKRP